jgi:hypothetical protein
VSDVRCIGDVEREEPALLVDLNDAARLFGRITPRGGSEPVRAGGLGSVKLVRRGLIVVESIDVYVGRLRMAASTLGAE